MLKVIGMLLVQVNSAELGDIDKFWDKKLCMKTWYNSKIFMNFINSSCVIFLSQNVTILPNCILLSSLVLYDFQIAHHKNK